MTLTRREEFCLAILLATTVACAERASEATPSNASGTPVAATSAPSGSDSVVRSLFAVVGARFVPIHGPSDWPDDWESGVLVVRGADRRVRMVQEEPRSESGDWTLIQQHFFDSLGRTTRYESSGRYFQEQCPTGIMSATFAVNYDTAFRITQTVRALRDTTGAVVDPEKCGHVYSFFDGEPVASFAELIRLRRAPPDSI